MLYFLIAIAGFFGALIRVLVVGSINSLLPLIFPLGTFIVNLTGSFLMCLFMTLALEIVMIRNEFKTAIATGLLGAYTTFSIFSFQTYSLVTSGHLLLGGLYFIGTPISCVAFGYFGLITGKAVINKYQK